MEQHTDIYYKLGEIHGDVKNILIEAKRTNGRVTKLESETIPKLERRVDNHELRMAYWAGAIGVIIFIINLIGGKILSLF